MHDPLQSHSSNDWDLPQRAMQKRTAIAPFPIPHQVIPVTSQENSDTITFGVPHTDPERDEPTEQRYCLASLVPGLEEATAFALQPAVDSASEDKAEQTNANGLPAFRNPAGVDKFYSLLHKLGYSLYGGTGLNQGRFYGVQWPEHGMHYAYEPLSYLSLLFTPLATVGDGTPLVFTDLKILVASDEAMEAAGLPAGYGTALSWTDFGQIRTLIGDRSIGKGVAIGFDTAAMIGLEIPEEWYAYDLVVCASDVKINPVAPGEYAGAFGVTWDNIRTIRSQSIRLGFEFWQFVRQDRTIMHMLEDQIAAEHLPSYEQMMLGMAQARQLAAYREGRSYQPLQLQSKLMEALSVLGSQYPWVAEKLEATVANYLLTKPFAGTRYQMTIIVKDGVQNAYHHTEDGDAQLIAGKYPITAGLMQLRGNGESTAHFLVLEQSTADQFAIDADGDAAFVCEGALFTEMLHRNLVKPVRDIAVASRRKRTNPLTLPNLARDAWHILTTSGEIGSLTIGYYLSEVANDALGFDIDLSLYYQMIEATIKSSKHDMDLSRLHDRNWETEQLLKSELAMPYHRAQLDQLRKAINTGAMTPDLLKQQRISEPPHYMEHLWNATLDRIQHEISQLRDGVQPLSHFASHIGPVLLPPVRWIRRSTRSPRCTAYGGNSIRKANWQHRRQRW